MLEKELQKFAKSKKFKEAVKQKRKDAILGNTGGSGSSGGSGGTLDDVYKYAQELRDMLSRRVG